MDTFLLGIALFTLIVLALVTVIMAARSQLVSTGNVEITINDERKISVPAGGKLLQTLSEQKLFVPSACGGGGTCAQWPGARTVGWWFNSAHRAKPHQQARSRHG